MEVIELEMFKEVLKLNVPEEARELGLLDCRTMELVLSRDPDGLFKLEVTTLGEFEELSEKDELEEPVVLEDRIN